MSDEVNHGNQSKLYIGLPVIRDYFHREPKRHLMIDNSLAVRSPTCFFLPLQQFSMAHTQYLAFLWVLLWQVIGLKMHSWSCLVNHSFDRIKKKTFQKKLQYKWPRIKSQNSNCEKQGDIMSATEGQRGFFSEQWHPYLGNHSLSLKKILSLLANQIRL